VGVHARCPASAESERLVSDVVTDDLEFCGFFVAADAPRNLPPDAGIPFWSSLGAELLVVIDIVPQPPTLIARVIDVEANKDIFAKQYKSGGNLRTLSHALADEVIETLTGIPGIAQTKIAYLSEYGGKYSLNVIDYDGANPAELISSKSMMLSPSWSPDGGHIAYTSYMSGFPDLYILSLASGQPRLVSAFPGINAFAGFSPDGRSVLLTLSLDGNPEVYEISLEDGSKRRLTSSKAIDSSPCYSPDGKKMAFVSDRGGSPQVYLAELGKKPERLTYSGNYNVSPAWSPDGRYICYTARLSGNFEICVIDAGGDNLRQLTFDPAEDDNPSWAPDSRHIVYSSTDRGETELKVLNVFEGWTRELEVQGNPSGPSWSPKFE
jgi:TolB protein